jgi:hypothetical protein
MYTSKAIRAKKPEDDGTTASQRLSALQEAVDFSNHRSTSAQSFDAGRDQTITGAALESAGAVTPAAVSPPFNPAVVQIIDTTQWSKSSPDPAGLTFIPGATSGSGTLLMSDSEIDETPFFRPDNLFYLSETGVFDHSASLQSFTKEPTGIAFNPLNGHLFISDDNTDKVFEVDPNNPGTLISSFSTKTFGADDVEDIIFDPVTGNLLISEGEQSKLNPRTIFEVTISGTLVSSVTLPVAVGDPEGFAYDAERNVFYICGHTSENILVVSRDGQIIDTITLLQDYRNPSGTGVKPKGLTMAPSSDPNDDPNLMSLWVADYGKDQFMDGRLIEIQLSSSSPVPPLFTISNDVVDFNQVNAGTYQSGSQYNALAGNDTVTLAVDAAAAAAAGFDPAQTFNGGDGKDVVTGGTLNDLVSGGSGNDVSHGGGGNDTLAGDGSADSLNGGDGNDSLNGGSSSDTLIGGLGDDLLNGGSSNDTLDYTAAAGPVTINLALGTATGDGNDTLLNVENVTGSSFEDTITGNTVANVLIGGGGNDTIGGGDGNDVLTGGTGIDQVFGEVGHDTLKWDSADFLDGGIGFDTLDAILSSADTIDLRGANFANLERIRTGSGKDIVTLSLNDVLSDTADNQFVADLGSSSPDTLNIDLAGGWSTTAPNSTLGPTGVAAGISVSGMTARTFTNGVDSITVFSNAEVVNAQILSS